MSVKRIILYLLLLTFLTDISSALAGGLYSNKSNQIEYKTCSISPTSNDTFTFIFEGIEDIEESDDKKIPDIIFHELEIYWTSISINLENPCPISHSDKLLNISNIETYLLHQNFRI
ncbi:MAG: hypothetical protein J0M08_08655 [Bacteroidetes bacterium]|nr:hypothetical protein [Bacteroidota bacterium]